MNMTQNSQQPPNNIEPLDLLVIGAGIYGVQAARTYLTLHPTHNIRVLEAGDSPGGVWSKGRIYPHFFTQSPLEIWEFSDKKLNLPDGEERCHEYFPAKHFANYLEEYVDEHMFEGKSLRERILCQSAVENLSKEGKVWRATTFSGATYTARRVIDATGLTSFPSIPRVAGSASFQGLQIHNKDFARQSSAILQPQRRVVIIGGGKSAGDVAYACAKSGVKQIRWVIRKSGNGPAAYLPPDAPVKKYTNSNSAFHTSFMSTITACIYTPQSWWTWFLYQTFVGRALLGLIWIGVQSDVYGRAKYHRKDATAQENGFSNLKPDGPLFWQLSSSGVNQRPDFYDTIAEKVKVYRQNIDSISASSIKLQDGTTIDADIIIYATGWNETTPYIKPQTALELGLATDISTVPPKTDKETFWSLLEQKADTKVLAQFPCLANQPTFYKKPAITTPFRLYRSIFPPTSNTPTIAFLGRTNFANGTYNAEIQSLFVTAVFDGHLKLPSHKEMEEEIALVNAWMKRRYPAKGGRGDFFFFDVVPYTDRLLADLGMARLGEVRGLFGEMGAKRLRGMVEKYAKMAAGEEGKKTV